jgi:hypothetical protein
LIGSEEAGDIEKLLFYSFRLKSILRYVRLLRRLLLQLFLHLLDFEVMVIFSCGNLLLQLMTKSSRIESATSR